jgi:hypothetical protein
VDDAHFSGDESAPSAVTPAAQISTAISTWARDRRKDRQQWKLNAPESGVGGLDEAGLKVVYCFKNPATMATWIAVSSSRVGLGWFISGSQIFGTD